MTDLLHESREVLTKGVALLDRFMRASQELIGRIGGGPLPDLIEPEWLTKNWGDPRLFYWRVDPLDMLLLGRTISVRVLNFALSVEASEALRRWIPGDGEGKPSDELYFGEVYGQHSSMVFIPSIKRFIAAGYIRVNGVILKEEFYKRLILERTKAMAIERQGQPRVDASPASAGNAFAQAAKRDYDTIVIPKVRELAAKDGLNADLLVGQLNLESANGTKPIRGAYNYGGIKATKWSGRVIAKTTEFFSGKKQAVQDAFRAFASPQEFAEYYVNWLAHTTSNKWYKAAVRTSDNAEAARMMVKGGYATDPQYAAKLAAAADRAANDA